MKIVIPGEPISQERARCFMMSKKLKFYNPQASEKNKVKKTIEKYIKNVFLEKNKGMEVAEISVAEFLEVELIFYCLPPKSLSTRKINHVLWGILKCINKKDIDNMVKFYLDCGNQMFWTDDHIITKLKAKKVYSYKPRTEITIMTKKKELSDECYEILSLFNPVDIDDIIQTAECLKSYLYSLGSENLENEKNPSDLKQIASLISELAETHANSLKKVAKLCPRFHERCKTPMEGRVLC